MNYIIVSYYFINLNSREYQLNYLLSLYKTRINSNNSSINVSLFIFKSFLLI